MSKLRDDITDLLKEHCYFIYSNAHSEMTNEQFLEHINELTPAYTDVILKLINVERKEAETEGIAKGADLVIKEIKNYPVPKVNQGEGDE